MAHLLQCARDEARVRLEDRLAQRVCGHEQPIAARRLCEGGPAGGANGRRRIPSRWDVLVSAMQEALNIGHEWRRGPPGLAQQEDDDEGALVGGVEHETLQRSDLLQHIGLVAPRLG